MIRFAQAGFSRAFAFALTAVLLAMAPLRAMAVWFWPAGYVPVEYAESTGTQYVDTEINPNGGTPVVRIDYAMTDTTNDKYVFGYWDNNMNRGTLVGIGGSKNYWRVASKSYSASTMDTDRHVAAMNTPTGTYVDGTCVKADFANVSEYGAGNTRSYYAFARNHSSGVQKSSSRIYSLAIDLNGATVRDFVPVRRLSDGAAGLLDRVSERFFASKGDPLVSGPDLPGIFVAGDPAEIGAPEPEYGFFTNVTLGASTVFTCPAVFTNQDDTVASECLGYRLVLTNGTEFAGTSTSTSIVYSAETAYATLVWRLGVQYKATVKKCIGGVETAVGAYWSEKGGRITVTAPVAPTGYVFYRWKEIEGADALKPVQTLQLSAPATLTALYASTSFVDATWTGAGGDTSFATAGNWSNNEVPGLSTRATISPDAAVSITMPANQEIGELIVSNATIAANGKVFVVSNVTVRSDATLTHTALSSSANELAEDKIGLDLLCASLTIEAGGKISSVGKGFASQKGPGYAGGNVCGVHGGTYSGGDALCYGSIVAPINSGSGGRWSAGGGAVCIVAGDLATVNGTIDASGGNLGGGQPNYPGAGGSVWITAKRLAGTGTVAACGGNVGGGGKGGAPGGRIAVYLTEDADFGAWHGKLSTKTGDCGTYGSPLGSGTVYLQAAGQTPTTATVIIDNGGANYRGAYGGYTVLNAKVGGDIIGNLIVTNWGNAKFADNETVHIHGSINHRTGRLTAATGSAGATIDFAGPADATIEGTNALPNVTCMVGDKKLVFGTTAQDTLRFLAGSSVMLCGMAGHLLELAGAGGGTWRLALGGQVTTVFNYLLVSGSDASSGNPALAYSSSPRSGAADNRNWIFVGAEPTEAATWTGAVDADWNKAGNWDIAKVPSSATAVTIPSGCATMPVVSGAAASAGTLAIAGGAGLTLSGANLAVLGKTTVKGSLVFAGSERMSLYGDVDLSQGTLTSGRGDVFLDGTGDQVLDLADQTLNKLTSRKLAGSLTMTKGFKASVLDIRETLRMPVTFAAGETFECGKLLLDDLVLTSSAQGTKWNLKVTRSADVTGVTVSDSAATGKTIPADTTSREGIPGSTTGWTFTSLAQTWIGPASGGTWETAANWSGNTVPDANSRVTIEGAVSITANAKATVQNLVVGDGVFAATVVFKQGLTSGDSVEVLNLATVSLDKPSVVTTDVAVRNGGTLTHTALPAAANTLADDVNGVDITCANLTVEAGGKIDATGKGFDAQKGPGYENSRGAHGGTYTNGYCYGDIANPVNCGSGGKNSRGGGRVKVVASGAITVDGSVLATGAKTTDGQPSCSGAGGSVLFVAQELLGSGTINACGGENAGGGATSGCGGRIAVRLTQTGDFSSWHGVFQVQGGKHGSNNKSANGSSGTLYLQAAGGAETVTADNSGVDTGSPIKLTEFPVPGAAGSPKRVYRSWTLEVKSLAKISLTADAYVYDIDFPVDKSYIELNGHTLTVLSSTHKDGKGWYVTGDADPIETHVIPGEIGGVPGRIVWKRPGSVIVIR